MVESGLRSVGREKSAVQARSNVSKRRRSKVTKTQALVLAQVERCNGTFRFCLKAEKSKTLEIEGEAFFWHLVNSLDFSISKKNVMKVWNAIKTARPHVTLNRQCFCPFWKDYAECKKLHKIERRWAHCTEGLFSLLLLLFLFFLVGWLSQLSAPQNSFQQVNQVVECVFSH